MDSLDYGANALLTRLLPAEEHGDFFAALTSFKSMPEDVLFEAGSEIEFVYFPAGVVLSALNVMPDGNAIEVATIGREGAIGLIAAYGQAIATNRVIVQIPGNIFRLPAEVLREQCRHDADLADLVFRYQQAFMAQVSQSVACNGLHKLEQRCCRWLLMTHDRVGADHFPLTHEFLAMMLGVRRAGVSEVLQELKDCEAIDYTRGSISVLSRPRLEAISCECYRVSEREYARLLG